MLDVFDQLQHDARDLKGLARLRFTAGLLIDTLSTAPRVWSAALSESLKPSHAPSRSTTMDRFSQDLRYALRAWAKSPGFAAILVATLALGIGANTAIFTLVNEIVLRPLPIGDPPGVVDLFAQTPGGNSFTGFSYTNYLELNESNDVLSGLSVFTGMRVRLGSDMAAEPVSAQLTSANYFDVLDVEPVLGRTFRPEEGVLGAGSTVAVVSHRFWQRHNGGDPSILGSTLQLNGTSFTVIGVTPEGFDGTFIGFPMELWLPLPTAETLLPNFNLMDGQERGLELIGRLGPGISIDQAQAAFDVLALRLQQEHPVDNKGLAIGVAPTTGVDHSMRGGTLGFLGILMVVAGLVLLITCLNVGNMLLARAASRQKEMSIRSAMGAGRGTPHPACCSPRLCSLSARRRPGHGRGRPPHHGLVWLCFVPAHVAGIRARGGLAGIVIHGHGRLAHIPGRRHLPGPGSPASGPRFHAAVRDEAATDGQPARLRNIFVVAQVAGAVALLIGAGLFLRSLHIGASLDPGFDADKVAATTITLSESDYGPERTRIFFEQLQGQCRPLTRSGVGRAGPTPPHRCDPESHRARDSRLLAGSRPRLPLCGQQSHRSRIPLHPGHSPGARAGFQSRRRS